MIPRVEFPNYDKFFPAATFAGLGGLLGAVGAVSTINQGKSFLNLTSEFSLFMYSVLRYYGINDVPNPAAVIGGIPLGTVSELSQAISDREVRYRANGGVFLADQNGGNESLRIVGLSWGPNRYLFLSMLEFLFLFGSEQMVDTFSGADLSDASFLSQESAAFNPWLNFEIENYDQGMSEKHFTFPIVTKNRVYFSMYIETFHYTESIRNGQEAVEYTIFFRKYDPIPDLEFKTIIVPDFRSQNGFKVLKCYREKINNQNRLIRAVGAETLLEIGSTLAVWSIRSIIKDLPTRRNTKSGIDPSFIGWQKLEENFK